ncbi:amidase [Metabacillus herbersteinensis]|uniref:Amidase n=1 Tax=Metabacillus herbersteinensis TaxID=283816 RepID=A0ABV6GIC4_9BACI
MNELFFKDIHSVANLLKKQEISPVELTKQLLDRIDDLEPSLNAYITVLYDDAMKQAESLERELLDGNIRSPLHGVPIAIKDIFETKGSRTTSGSKIFEQSISNRDADVVKLLKDAGAIIIGKTNLHEFAMGATTENPHYGPTRNPWNIKKIPGGSSGGSAVAVAAGMGFGAVGTDTGGSIRLPASLCGIVGIKPTYDLVSRKGCTPLSWTLDHIGPMTRTVADSRIMLKIMAAPVKKNRINLEIKRNNLNGIRIGICENYFFENMDQEMKRIVNQSLIKLKELGAEVVDITIPGIGDALEAHKIISKSEAYTFHEPSFKKNPEMYGEDSQFRLNSGNKVLASEYINALHYREKFIQNLLDSMAEYKCDVLFSPTNSIPAFDIGSVPPEESINNIFHLGRTPIGNLLGFPVMTVPCGFTAENLPVGFQLTGKHYDDGLLLSIGELYEQSENWVSYLEKNEAYLIGNVINT